jgi:hypothetical protein
MSASGIIWLGQAGRFGEKVSGCRQSGTWRARAMVAWISQYGPDDNDVRRPQKRKPGAFGSPSGQWQVSPVSVTTVTGICGAGSSSGNTGTTFIGAKGGREWIDSAARRRGLSIAVDRRDVVGGRDVLGRPARPRRWTLPMTALRVTWPSSAAMVEALCPLAQRIFNCSTRSSVQVMMLSRSEKPVLAARAGVTGSSLFRSSFAWTERTLTLWRWLRRSELIGRLERTADNPGEALSLPPGSPLPAFLSLWMGMRLRMLAAWFLLAGRIDSAAIGAD